MILEICKYYYRVLASPFLLLYHCDTNFQFTRLIFILFLLYFILFFDYCVLINICTATRAWLRLTAINKEI